MYLNNSLYDMSHYFCACHENTRMHCLSVTISCQWSFPEIERNFVNITEIMEFDKSLWQDLWLISTAELG